MTNLDSAINKISQDAVLTEKEMISVMQEIMSGDADSNQIETFLTSLSARGESVSEITGAARVMRDMAATIKSPDLATDCCGTGGDGMSTYNISTAVGFVLAACDIPVAKHGNRAASSKSGAADALEALGVNLDMPLEKLEQALIELNFCFLMAPAHHQAMKHVVPIRKKIGKRTIFNLLGPLANPANTKYQLIGVYDKKWLRPMAEVLNNLGTKKAWLVHGHDGLDEITTTDKTDIVILDNGKITEKTISPDDFGLPIADAKDLTGGDAQINAQALLNIFNGEHNAYRDIVCANAAAVLMMHDKVDDLKAGTIMASEAIDSGKAQEALIRYMTFSQGTT